MFLMWSCDENECDCVQITDVNIFYNLTNMFIIFVSLDDVRARIL